MTADAFALPSGPTKEPPGKEQGHTFTGWQCRSLAVAAVGTCSWPAEGTYSWPAAGAGSQV